MDLNKLEIEVHNWTSCANRQSCHEPENLWHTASFLSCYECENILQVQYRVREKDVPSHERFSHRFSLLQCFRAQISGNLPRVVFAIHKERMAVVSCTSSSAQHSGSIASNTKLEAFQFQGNNSTTCRPVCLLVCFKRGRGS